MLCQVAVGFPRISQDTKRDPRSWVGDLGIRRDCKKENIEKDSASKLKLKPGSRLSFCLESNVPNYGE